VKNAIATVGALAAEGKPGALAIKLRAPPDQFFDTLRGFFDENLGCFGVAESIAGRQRVLKMETYFIFVTESRSDASLGILRARVGYFALGQHQDASSGSELDSRTETGYSGTDDEEVSFRSGWHCWNGITAN
jgi:hypothetical protein